MPWHPLSTRDARETSKVDDMSGSLDGWIGAGGGGLGGGRAGLGGKKVGDELGRGLGLGFGRGGGGGGGERKEEDLLFRSMEGMEWVGEVVEFAAGGEEGGEGENDKEVFFFFLSFFSFFLPPFLAFFSPFLSSWLESFLREPFFLSSNLRLKEFLTPFLLVILPPLQRFVRRWLFISQQME